MGKFTQNSIMVAGDVKGWYPSIPHNGLKIFEDPIDFWQKKKIPFDVFVQMGEFVLTNNYFGFGHKVRHHSISGTAFGTKFPQPFA